MSVIRPLNLIQWKTWVNGEIRIGHAMKHSSGRSIRAHAAKHVGLKPRAKRGDLVARIELLIGACHARGIGPLEQVDVSWGAEGTDSYPTLRSVDKDSHARAEGA